MWDWLFNSGEAGDLRLFVLLLASLAVYVIIRYARQNRKR